jgi:hypothetical protein
MRNDIISLTAGALLSLLGSGDAVARACDRLPCIDRQPASACTVEVDCLDSMGEYRPEEPRYDVRRPTKACDTVNCPRTVLKCPPDADCMPPFWPVPPAVAERCDPTSGGGWGRNAAASMVSVTRVGACDPQSGIGCRGRAPAS